MFAPNKRQRLALIATALVVGVGTASLVVAEGFQGVTWIGGVLITAFLVICALNGPDRSETKRPGKSEETPATLFKNGTTQERAWVIAAKNSAEGIKAEYAVMSKIFGQLNKDWKVVSRRMIDKDAKVVEHFILSTKDGRKEIYFDISSFVRNNVTLPDGVPQELHDAMLNRMVTIKFIPRAAFDLRNFVFEHQSHPKLTGFLGGREIAEINSAFEARRRRADEESIIIDLPAMTAIKLGVFLDMFRKDTSDLEIQDWLDNCSGAIRYALKSS